MSSLCANKHDTCTRVSFQTNECRRHQHKHTHTQCNEHSWRGCRRVHEEEEAEREGGMSSASHLGCQILAVHLGIYQREPALPPLFSSLLHYSLLFLFSYFLLLSVSKLSLPLSLPPSFTFIPVSFLLKSTCLHAFPATSEKEGVCV